MDRSHSMVNRLREKIVEHLLVTKPFQVVVKRCDIKRDWTTTKKVKMNRNAHLGPTSTMTRINQAVTNAISMYGKANTKNEKKLTPVSEPYKLCTVTATNCVIYSWKLKRKTIIDCDNYKRGHKSLEQNYWWRTLLSRNAVLLACFLQLKQHFNDTRKRHAISVFL